MQTDHLIEFIEQRLTEDELWAKAASAPRYPEDGGETVVGGVHWTWAVGDQWEPVQPDPLEPYMGGYEGQWSQPVVLRTVEEWHLGYGGPGNTLPNKIAESEELRTADGAHIVRHDPARVLRELPLKRRLLDEHRPRPIVDPNGDERGDWPERVCRICDPRWMGTPDWARDEDFVPPAPEYCEYLRMLGSIWSDHPDFCSIWNTEEAN